MFGLLVMDTFMKIHSEKSRRKRRRKKLKLKEFDYDYFILEFKVLGNFMKLGFLYLMTSIVVLRAITDFINVNVDLYLDNVMNYIVLVYFYFISVYITYSHWKWRQENINHLL